jgi:hypothetical protein
MSITAYAFFKQFTSHAGASSLGLVSKRGAFAKI